MNFAKYLMLLVFVTVEMVPQAYSAGQPMEDNIRQFLGLEKCYKGVRFSDRFMAVSVNSRGLLIQDNQQGEWAIDLKQELIDMQFDGTQLVILLSHALEVWDLPSRQQVLAFETHPFDLSLPQWNAGLAFDQHYYYIGLERTGVLKFDKQEGKYVETIILSQGSPSALALDGNLLYILADDMASQYNALFPGIAVYDLNLQKMKNQVILNGAPTGSIEVIGQDVFVGNRFYWKLAKSKILTKKMINNYSRVYIPEGSFARGFPEYTTDSIYFCQENGRPGKKLLQ